jgi:hypothetical protein
MINSHPYDKTDLLSYFTGGMTEEKRRAIESHAADCKSCRDYLSGLASEKSTFLAAHPFAATIKPEAPVRTARVIPFVQRRYLALAAMLVLFVAAGYLSLSGRFAMENRIKGETGLKAFVQSRTGTIEKRRDRIYYTGEKIQFLYSCSEANSFILLGFDTTGAMTGYFPATGDSSCVLERGADLPLPNSIVLDEYTGRELFLAVFSKKPLSVPDVKQRLAASFAAHRSIDSLDIKNIGDAVVISYYLTVLQGGR